MEHFSHDFLNASISAVDVDICANIDDEIGEFFFQISF